MNVLRFLMIMVLAWGPARVCLADMAPLSDASLSDVSGGGNGIDFEIYDQINTDQAGAPLAAFGTGCVGNTDQQGGTSPCTASLALQFSGREGTWLLLKNYYGSISIPDLHLDAYVNPVTNTSYYNAGRFKNSSAVCIGDISTCNPAGMGSFSFSFPSSSSISFSDMGLYLNIGRMAVEFDSTSTSCPTVNSGTTTNCGYNQDAFGSFAGVIVSDTSTASLTSCNSSGICPHQAQLSITGRVRVYGF